MRIDRLAGILLRWLADETAAGPDRQEPAAVAAPADVDRDRPPIDLQSLREDMGLDNLEIVRDVLGAFLEDMDTFIGALAAAIAERDRENLQSQAHAAKSAANSAAAFEVAEIMKELESRSPDAEWEALEAEFSRGRQEYETAKAWIQDFMHGS